MSLFPPFPTKINTNTGTSNKPKKKKMTPFPEWTPTSWRSKPIMQDVVFPKEDRPEINKKGLNSIRKKLGELPGLVSGEEVERLREHLAEVAQGNAFLLQGGDCAELFSYSTSLMIESKLKLLLLMSLIIVWGGKTKVVRVLRGAGQFGKPRSKPTEIVNGKEVISYRGDNVNGFDPSDRDPDAERLLGAYFHSSTTLNHIRSLLSPSSSFSSLLSYNPLAWSRSLRSWDHVRDKEIQGMFEQTVGRVVEAMEFMEVVGGGGGGGRKRNGKGNGGEGKGVLERVEMWTSHEGLLLEYEESLTRKCALPSSTKHFSPHPPKFQPPNSSIPPSPVSSTSPRSQAEEHNSPSASASDSSSPSKKNEANGEQNGTKAGIKPNQKYQHHFDDDEDDDDDEAWYNLSAHFLWIGDRTRNIDGAHVEYFRGLRNPIGIKCGPSLKPEDLIKLLEVLDPNCEPGRITLICRYGSAKVEEILPTHIKAVQSMNPPHPVIFACDPMHGNTRSSLSDPEIKTRHMSDIVIEISKSISIHSELGSRLGGIHLEMTGETNKDGWSVTECLGGSMELEEGDLERNYQTHCDPRLNYEQSLDVAFLISHYFQNERRGREMENKIMANLSIPTRSREGSVTK